MNNKFIKPVLFSVVISGVVGYTGFITADSNNRQIRVCRTEQCEQFSELVDINELFPQNNHIDKIVEDISIAETITITISLLIPLIVFVWWLINTQVEKKSLENDAKQDLELAAKLEKILERQDNTLGRFADDVDKIHQKIDGLAKQMSDTQIQAIKTIYEQNGKIEMLMHDLATIREIKHKVEDIENFLTLHQQYKIRLHKETLE